MTQNTLPFVEELNNIFKVFLIDKVYPLRQTQNKGTKTGDIVQIEMMDGKYRIVNKIMIDHFGTTIRDKCQEICQVIKNDNPQYPRIVSIVILEKLQ
jgi:hypothetical protein